MATNVLRWPSALRAAGGLSFNLRGRTIGGPVSLTGRTQVASIDTGYWVASLPLALLEAGGDVRAFRRLAAEMAGGAFPVLVPAFDEGQAPWPDPGGWENNVNPPQEWSDETQWSDGTGWYDPVIRVYLAEAAAARATSILLDVDNAGTIEGGELFSLAGGELHVIRRVLSSDESGVRVAIAPGIRAAQPAGRRCEFERPVCRMRLVSEDAADLSLGLLWHAAPSLAFVEI
jgi:hypothetical protein